VPIAGFRNIRMRPPSGSARMGVNMCVCGGFITSACGHHVVLHTCVCMCVCALELGHPCFQASFRSKT
jgi:hypothetical protein